MNKNIYEIQKREILLGHIKKSWCIRKKWAIVIKGLSAVGRWKKEFFNHVWIFSSIISIIS